MIPGFLFSGLPAPPALPRAARPWPASCGGSWVDANARGTPKDLHSTRDTPAPPGRGVKLPLVLRSPRRVGMPQEPPPGTAAPADTHRPTSRLGARSERTRRGHPRCTHVPGPGAPAHRTLRTADGRASKVAGSNHHLAVRHQRPHRATTPHRFFDRVLQPGTPLDDVRPLAPEHGNHLGRASCGCWFCPRCLINAPATPDCHRRRG